MPFQAASMKGNLKQTGVERKSKGKRGKSRCFTLMGCISYLDWLGHLIMHEAKRGAQPRSGTNTWNVTLGTSTAVM